ncbi:hypothetical protein DFS33DRAFT_1373523 [Desarmillaria ectypa]|nr:hypothetical protein DFS33DRAFT_1373523 [Desarmillaria ectypa]
MGLIDMFLLHLDKELPTDFSDADRSLMSLLGLSKISNFLHDRHPYEQQMVDGWPGAFKWSVYLVAGRVQSSEATPQSKRSTLDVITAAYSRNMEASTADMPTASACLDVLLYDEIKNCLDQVVKSGSGNADNIAQLAMNHTTIVIYLDLIGRLCRKPRHPLRHAFLNFNVIPMFTKIALNAPQVLSERAPDIMFDVLNDGFTWVLQAVNASLLAAWVDSSPHFHRLHTKTETRGIGVSKIDDESLPHRNRVFGSTARDVWIDFHERCPERLLVSIHAKAISGKAVTCDNYQKVDVKNNSQKCSGCGTTLYCSEVYQKVAWKEGGHTDVCKMKQQERKAFFHNLATRDARPHLPYLHRLTRKEYPKIQGLLVYHLYRLHSRNEAFVKRARENPEKFMLIQSQLSNGTGVQLVTSFVTDNFWNSGTRDSPSDDSQPIR